MKKVPNEFNLGMDNRSAIYIPFAQAVPKVATIDPSACNMLKNGKCGICSKVCAAGAIDYTQKDEYIQEATIIAKQIKIKKANFVKGKYIQEVFKKQFDEVISMKKCNDIARRIIIYLDMKDYFKDFNHICFPISI